MAEEVQIVRSENGWAAFVGNRQVTKRACKNCVINMIKKMTAKSHRYHKIIVRNEDGTQTVYETGVVDAGKAEES